ncbi:MAG: hypothetical protein PVH17_12695, partial [Anaerolineae bacterium]
MDQEHNEQRADKDKGGCEVERHGVADLIVEPTSDQRSKHGPQITGKGVQTEGLAALLVTTQISDQRL